MTVEQFIRECQRERIVENNTIRELNWDEHLLFDIFSTHGTAFKELKTLVKHDYINVYEDIFIPTKVQYRQDDFYDAYKDATLGTWGTNSDGHRTRKARTPFYLMSRGHSPNIRRLKTQGGSKRKAFNCFEVTYKGGRADVYCSCCHTAVEVGGEDAESVLDALDLRVKTTVDRTRWLDYIKDRSHIDISDLEIDRFDIDEVRQSNTFIVQPYGSKHNNGFNYNAYMSKKLNNRDVEYAEPQSDYMISYYIFRLNKDKI